MDAETLLQKSDEILKDSENILEKRKQKIINWLKNPYNFAFVGILALASVIRLYYLILTQYQPLWWDEAEYMGMAKSWAFGLDYKFHPVRAVLLPLISAFFLKIANNEFLPRLFMFLLSIASIAGAYYLGKEIYDKKIGLIASFLMSIFYLNLFYSCRLLVDLPSLTFYTFSAFFFYGYLKKHSNKMLYTGAAIVAIGTLFKLPTAALLFAIAINLLITEKLKFLKKKEIWIAATIFILILSPYIIWGYLQFHGFVITQAGARNAPKENYLANGFSNIKSYFSIFPTLLSWPLLIIFISGIILMYKLFLGFDILIKGENLRLKKDLFLILIFLIPIIIVSFSMGGGYFEDRYILNAFPAVFIISGNFILKVYNFLRERRKILAVSFLIILLGSITYIQLQHTDSLINNKKDSYLQVKEAGLWLKENSELSDIIMTKSWPQIKYYSERQTVGIPETEEEVGPLLTSNQNIKFYEVSAFEPHQQWMYSYPQKNNLTAVQAYFADPQNTQPVLIIYRV